MKNILVRADSSSTIGTGHIMRDLVLASQYPNNQITFAVQELKGNISHKIEEEGYNLEILSTNDVEELDTLIKKLNIDMIVIDHYDIDETFEKELKINNPKLIILSFDDTYKKHYCDILLNHNIYAEVDRYKDLVPQYCELRCGENYTLLRDEFREAKKNLRENQSFLTNVFVAMGGTDIRNLNTEILKQLSSFQNIHVDVVTTTSNPNLEELKSYIEAQKWITLHINTSKMATLLAESDLAIVTPSVTLNEVWFMKVPFIAIQVADNQVYMKEFLKMQNRDVLESYNAYKLKELLQKYLFVNITLTNFTQLSLEEQTMVLQWRNHPNIRRWMYHKEIISLQDHLDYIKSLDNKHDRYYFLVKKDGQALGVIDFSSIDKKLMSAEIGLYARPETKGVGSILMQEILHYVLDHLKLKILYANVFLENDKAIKLYQRFGFKELKQDNKLIYMELCL